MVFAECAFITYRIIFLTQRVDLGIYCSLYKHTPIRICDQRPLDIYMFCVFNKLYITLCKSTHRFQFDNGLHEWLQYCVYAILIDVCLN